MARTSIFSRVARLVGVGMRPVTSDNTSVQLPASVNPWSGMSSRWAVEHGRTAVHRDITQIDNEDEIVASALDVIADCATGYEASDQDSFRVIVEGNPEAQQVADDLVKRLDLEEKAWDITRKMVKYGNEFREVIIDDKLDIVRLKELPEEEIWPRRDQFGVPMDPPWEQRLASTQPGKGIAIQEWQIVHWHFGPMADNGLAVPMLKPTRKNWKRLMTLEDGMAMARMVRAYQKLVHRVPVNPNWSALEIEEAIRRYKNNITKKEILNWQAGKVEQIEDPVNVETDFYVPEDGQKRGGIESLDPKNAQLENVADVQYSQSRLLSRLKVPRRYLNIEGAKSGGINAEGSDAEDLQFARVLRKVQTQFRKGLKKLLHLQWFLKGIDYRQVKYRIEMPKVSTADAKRDSEIALNQANAANTYQTMFGGCMDPEFVFMHFMGLDADAAKDQATRMKSLQEEKQKMAMEMMDKQAKLAEKTAPKDGPGAPPAKPKPAGHERPPGRKVE